MIPFKEQTIKETGLKHKTPWDLQKANLKLQQFKREEVAIACKQDVVRAKAAGLEVEGDRLNTLVVGPDGNMAVDPIAAKIHHSGASVIDRTIARWRKFCSVPQNDDSMEYPVADYVPKEERKRGAKHQSPITSRIDTGNRKSGGRKQEMAEL